MFKRNELDDLILNISIIFSGIKQSQPLLDLSMIKLCKTILMCNGSYSQCYLCLQGNLPDQML